MRVKKNQDGTFAIEDESMRLSGEAADQFLREMEDRDQSEDNTERRRFLAECDEAYEQSVAKRSL